MSTLYGLVVKGKETAVPLESVSVTGHVKGYVLGLETTLSYRNNSDDPLEVLFRFPIDEGTAVVGLEAQIGGRTIRGVVQEKEEARATYDDAIASGLTAALGEEKTGDIFSLALGNLPPKEQAELVLKLAGELSLEGESVRFSLPTVLKPRYTPSGSKDPLTRLETPGSSSGSAPAVNKFNLKIANSDAIKTVTSPTHDIITSVNEGEVIVSLKELGLLVKDLVILIDSKEPHVPRANVEEGKPGANELMASPAVMLDFFPGFESMEAACEFVFVVDRSGSMSGGFINSAKETLILFLKSIPPGCYFNIIGFGSRYEHLFPKSVPYNQSNLDRAIAHANDLKANLGGTELLNPLSFVFGQKLLPGLPRQVFVLTDGSVSNTGACINETKKNANVARVFTFGIGSGASTELVKGLARAGNGSAEFIKEGDRMQAKVISSLKKALQPSVTDVNLSFSVSRGITVLQSPAKIPPVFNGEKLVLYGILKGTGSKASTGTATLTGNILGKSIKHKLEFKVVGKDGAPPPVDTAPIIHQLAAKSLIKDWEEDTKKKKEVIKLSVESGVVSKLTSYVAVDEDQDKPIEGAIKVWDLTATESSSNMLLSYSRQSYSRSQFISSPQASYYSLSFDPLSSGGAPLPLRSAANSRSSSHYRRPPMGGPPPPPAMAMFGAPPPPPPPPGAPLGGLMGKNTMNLGTTGLGCAPMGGGGGPPPPPPPPQRMMPAGGVPMESYDMLADCMDEDNESDEEIVSNLFGFSDVSSKSSSSSRAFNIAPVSSTVSSTTVAPAAGLSQLIGLQSADGYWSLDESLASLVGRSLSKLKAPSGLNESVWATLLALALLETRYKSQEDEWVLVGMKAERWLGLQSLSSSIDALKKTAIDAIK